jgi:hypothetical protein
LHRLLLLELGKPGVALVVVITTLLDSLPRVVGDAADHRRAE